MEPALVLILADPETHEGLGRERAGARQGTQVRKHPEEVLFNRAGTAMLADLGHRLHGLFAAVRDQALGAWDHCARAFGAMERPERLGPPLVPEFEGQLSLARLLKAGYRVLTF